VKCSSSEREKEKADSKITRDAMTLAEYMII